MKCPYDTMSNEELSDIIVDIETSKNKGIRPQSLLPYATDIYNNLNGATETVTMRECLEMAKQDFFMAVSKRFYSMTK